MFSPLIVAKGMRKSNEKIENGRRCRQYSSEC